MDIKCPKDTRKKEYKRNTVNRPFWACWSVYRPLVVKSSISAFTLAFYLVGRTYFQVCFISTLSRGHEEDVIYFFPQEKDQARVK